MSKQSDLIAAAIAANTATGTSLNQLAVDQAVLDSAVTTQQQHLDDAKAQADQDDAKVQSATAAIGSDLSAISDAAKKQADALAALGTLQNNSSTTTQDPNQVVPTTQAPEVTTTDPNLTTGAPTLP